jgi:hypothetical protein
MTLYNVACVRALAGRIEEAFQAIERAIDQGMILREWIEGDSNLAPLRGDPRFAALLGRLPLQESAGG